jgi:hypothetical protein
VAPHLALPDRLRADQAARSAYAQLKGRLAAQFSGDRCAYTAAETAFIQQLPSEDGRTATPTEQTSDPPRALLIPALHPPWHTT